MIKKDLEEVLALLEDSSIFSYDRKILLRHAQGRYKTSIFLGQTRAGVIGFALMMGNTIFDLCVKKEFEQRHGVEMRMINKIQRRLHPCLKGQGLNLLVSEYDDARLMLLKKNSFLRVETITESNIFNGEPAYPHLSEEDNQKLVYVMNRRCKENPGLAPEEIKRLIQNAEARATVFTYGDLY
jgi:hypothetical protein